MDENWYFLSSYLKEENVNYFNDVCVKTFLRFNYFNNGESNDLLGVFYDNSIQIELNKKYSSKNISDYYKGFSIIENGPYQGYLIDPSSLHIWDSTYENSSEIHEIRNQIICSINGVENNYKLCLPKIFNNIFYDYMEIGLKPLPIFCDVYYENNYDLVNENLNLNLSFPKIDLNFFNTPWYLRHFPIPVNESIYKNPLNCDYAKLIYFYYQRQNPYIQKAYVLSNTDYLFCNFSFSLNEKNKNIKNKFGIYFYGSEQFQVCSSLLNNSLSASYVQTGYAYPDIGSLHSSSCYYECYFKTKTVNQNTIFTSFDKNNNIYDFQQCVFVNCGNLNIDFLSCRNNFFVKDVENIECCSSFWFQNENLFLSQSNGLPNLDINDSNPSNQIISSDFLNQVRCRNVII
jgi:hypothetical protein